MVPSRSMIAASKFERCKRVVVKARGGKPGIALILPRRNQGSRRRRQASGLGQLRARFEPAVRRHRDRGENLPARGMRERAALHSKQHLVAARHLAPVNQIEAIDRAAHAQGDQPRQREVLPGRVARAGYLLQPLERSLRVQSGYISGRKTQAHQVGRLLDLPGHRIQVNILDLLGLDHARILRQESADLLQGRIRGGVDDVTAAPGRIGSSLRGKTCSQDRRRGLALSSSQAATLSFSCMLSAIAVKLRSEPAASPISVASFRRICTMPTKLDP